MITKIQIANKTYNVEYDYLHRGQNPRLVLSEKRLNRRTYVQFDRTGYVQQRLASNDLNETHRGYFVSPVGTTDVYIKIIEIK